MGGNPAIAMKNAKGVPTMICLEKSESCYSEKRLLVGILERALRDVLSIKGLLEPKRERKERRQAIDWFQLNEPFVQEEEPTPFSFQWVCDSLDVRPEKIHNRLVEAVMFNNREEFLKLRANMLDSKFVTVKYSAQLKAA